LPAGTDNEKGALSAVATSSLPQPSTRQDNSDGGCSFIPFPEDDTEQSIPVRFELQVLNYTDRTAISSRGTSLTYRAVNDNANRIARGILARTGSGQEPVAYLLTDDAKIIAAILGILKAGKIYVALDAAAPRARTSQVVEDAQPVLILTDSQNLGGVQETSGTVELLNIDAIPPSVPVENLELPLSPDSCAAIVYTSGSTGQPKGVLQNHRNLLHNVMNNTNSLRISADDRFCLLSSRTSAQAMTGIFNALLNGGAVCPFRIREEGLDHLSAWLVQEEITVYHSSASIFHRFARTLTGNEEFPRLRVVKLGGEPVSSRDLELYRQHFPKACIFVNGISSTETGTFRQYIADHDTTIEGRIVPVGYPVPDMEVLLLDDADKPVGSDCVGEIAVRSRYIAPGYWRKPDLTSAAFAPDPSGSGARIYRTGDLGRQSPDGCLHHLGRKDFQVKIRGNRVELAEVEMALMELAAIRQAVVVAREDQRGEQLLIAYTVPAAKPSPTAHSLRSALREKLPDYMVPSAFVMLDELPLTPQGKVDRQALPGPLLERNYVAPRNPLEAQLVEIWEETLDIRPIGVRDDFFELGGDSLLTVSVMTRIEQTFGRHLPVSTFLAGATVENLAIAIPNQDNEQTDSPLLKIQPRGSRKPFFFVHGGMVPEGGISCCFQLARYLGKERPFYALQSLRLETIEVMAASHLEVLRAVEPHGPYLLGGYCKGGLVAFEMAQQLRALGERVGLLVVIDAVVRNSSFRFHHKLVSSTARLLRLDADQQLDCFLRLRDFVICFGELSGLKQVTFVLKKVRKLGQAAKLLARLLWRNCQPKGVFTIPQPAAPTPDNPAGSNRRAPWNPTRSSRVVGGYVAYPYSGRVTVFSSNERQHKTDDPTLGWRHVASEVDLHVIPGDHQTCLTEHFDVSAKYLKSCLDNLE
jgi:amino acid adenylation domain-containing protein